MRTPDQAVVDLGPILDFLVRPHLNARLDDSVLANHRAIAHHRAFEHRRPLLQAALPSNNRAVQRSALADIAVAPDDAVMDARPVVQDGVIADHRWARHDNAAHDLHFRTQVDRPDELRVRLDTHRSSGPDIRPDPLSQVAQVQPASEQVGVGPMIFGQRADVAPIALGDISVQWRTDPEHPGEDILAPVQPRVCRNSRQRPRIDHIDACVDRVGGHRSPARFFKILEDASILLDVDHAVFEWIRHVCQCHRQGCIALLVERHDPGQVEIGERISADHQERLVLAQAICRVADRAGRAERRLLHHVVNVHAKGPPIAEVILDLRRQVLDGDDDIGDVVVFEQVEDMPEDRAIDQRQHRFGPR